MKTTTMKSVQKISAVKNQAGATLVVALVILAVMTILGVSTMNSSTLQERMANNARQKLIADSAAESALREAEEWLFNEITNRASITNHFLVTPTQGCYSDRTISGLSVTPIRQLATFIGDLSDDDEWLADATESRSVVDINAAWTDGDWARTPRVVIELLGPLRAGTTNQGAGTAQNLDVETAPSYDSPWVFRITAIGWSKNPDIYSVLQSTYTTGRQFGG
ncbi:hypothetical protein TDB9533_00949 [Thalassocella blandensis]|nr:hypothetical protein TDB9533_00949 [Thalassocella blandensis]